jgi:hypothetical protein
MNAPGKRAPSPRHNVKVKANWSQKKKPDERPKAISGRLSDVDH